MRHLWTIRTSQPHPTKNDPRNKWPFDNIPALNSVIYADLTAAFIAHSIWCGPRLPHVAGSIIYRAHLGGRRKYVYDMSARNGRWLRQQDGMGFRNDAALRARGRSTDRWWWICWWAVLNIQIRFRCKVKHVAGDNVDGADVSTVCVRLCVCISF